MKLYEEIYTSSAELLDGGSGNLGVVARTRGFPRELETELSTYRSYTLLDGLPLDAAHLHPPRFVITKCGKSKEYLLVSQTVFAGADFTGRTRPLTHQVLIELDEVGRSCASVATLAAAVFPLMFTAWEQRPAWIDPPRSLTLPHSEWPSLPGSFDAGTFDNTGATVVSIADALMNFPRSGRAIVVSLSPSRGAAVRDLAIKLLSFLPPSVQPGLPVASHIVEVSDCPRNAALLFTYCDTPFLAHTIDRQDPRRPFLLDLTRDTTAWQCDGPFSKTFERLREPCSSAELVAMSRRWDEWGFTDGDAHEFPLAYTLHRALASAKDPRELAQLGNLVHNPGGRIQLLRHIERWCEESVERLAGLGTDSRWGALAFIHSDHRWPETARLRARNSICSNWRRSLPYLVSHGDAALESLLAAPDVVEQVLAAVALDTAPESIALARAVCERMPWNLQRVVKCLAQLHTSSQQMGELLRPVLLKRTAANVRRAHEIEILCHSSISYVSKDPDYGREVCKLLLRPHVQHARPGPALDRLSQLLMEVSVSCGRADTELDWLINAVGRQNISSQLIERWTAAAGRSSDPMVMFPERPARMPRMNSRRSEWFPIAWLFPTCAATGIVLLLLFLYDAKPWTWPRSMDIDHWQKSIPLAPLFVWILFECALRLLFPANWLAHAIGRAVLLISMIVSAGWISLAMFRFAAPP